MANDLGFIPTKRSENYYFISYSSEDINYVSRISRKLHDQSIPLWYDRGINYGENWEVTISKKIIHCTAVILFLSPHVLKKIDSYVWHEFQIALDKKKPVYVLLLKEIDENNIPEETYHFWVKIKTHQGITAFKMNEETVLHELGRALEQTPVSREIISDQLNKKQKNVESDKTSSSTLTHRDEKAYGIENNTGVFYSDTTSLSSFTKTDNPTTKESDNTVSSVSAPAANSSEKPSSTTNENDPLDILTEEDLEALFGYVSDKKDSTTTTSKATTQKPSPYKQDKKQYIGISDGLDDLRETIYSFFNGRSKYPSSELLTYVKKYYKGCVVEHGESDTLTSSAYELMAYITYRDKLYRDAIPLLKNIYKKKTAQLGRFHQETIDVLFMLADANQNKDSMLPSSKYQKEFIKLAKEFTATEFYGEDIPVVDSNKLTACKLCKPWNTYKHNDHYSYTYDNITYWKELCDYKLLRSYVGENVLRKQRHSIYDHYYDRKMSKETTYKDNEYMLYVSDLLYGPLSKLSKEILQSLGFHYYSKNVNGKAIYYYRLYFERCIARLEEGVSGSLADTRKAADDLYECYKALNLETCPQAQEALKKYEELKEY